MKKTVLTATLAFWLLMIVLVIAGKRDEFGNGAQVAQAPGAQTYTLKDVARHAVARDCWMAIRGQVYDFSAYIPQHPAAPEVMTRHCGTDATRAFDTRDRGRPHSEYARSLLDGYRVGVLRD
jgi:cytochrome b involved in lipid metabolism